MMLEISTVIPAIATVLYTALYILVAANKPQNILKRRFRWYLLSMLIWSFSGLMVMTGYGNTTSWFRLMTAGGVAAIITMLYFTQAVVNDSLGAWSSIVYVYGFAAVAVSLFTDLVIPYASINNGELDYKLSSLIALVVGPGYLLTIFRAFQLFRISRGSHDETNTTRYVLLIIAIIVILAGGASNFVGLGKYPVDIAANVVAALIITYSILRHQLLDIQVVIRKSILYTIPTMIIGVAYFLLITGALLILNANTQSDLFMISLVVSIIAAIFIQPFRDMLQNWVDRFFFRERYSEVMMLQRVSQTASSVIDIDQLSEMILREISDTMHIKKAALFLRNENQKNFFLNTQIGITLSPRTKIVADHPLIARINAYDHAITKRELETHPIFRSMWREEKEIIDNIEAQLFIPLKTAGELLGVIILGPKLSEQPYSNQDNQILLTLSQQTAVAVDNAQLYSIAQRELVRRRETEKRLQLQLKRLSALQNINIAITTNIDLQIPLYLLLEQVTNELAVDAADVLLLDDESQELVFVAGRGFKTDALRYTKLNMGQGLAGKAAETGEVIRINNLNDKLTSLHQSPLIKDEKFLAYFGVPLITKGKVKGVLEIFHRSELYPDDDWLDFLNTLTSETAIAVDNAQMLQDLEKSNLDLVNAYDTTIEGWARTLELRDRETEGHSQRVMDLTMRLSRKLGIPEDEIKHIQRGALLHDIGKMGIPDKILLKKGPLTEEEWVVMRKHPQFARDMLSAIPFLEKAIDIPYYHHERWDGTGYPCGLRGEDIPLSARIFAIVDVWDALRSDRPYRKAWTDEEALNEIKRGNGTHFDPVVVKAFMEVIDLEQRNKRMK
ncbi:MAG: GAF domain-containing protein [Anaerolineaceae bacterium]|nr:GAF domain-containing protein [Anaerolineaceae bacterium]